MSYWINHLGKSKVFSKVDLWSRYYQIHVTKVDIQKTIVNTRYCHFEFTAMLVALTNMPTTFNKLMQDIFQPYLDDFVFVFFDDIMVYSKNQLYAKCTKCTFFTNKIEYLGFIVSKDGVSIDPKKIEAIINWPTLRNVKEV